MKKTLALCGSQNKHYFFLCKRTKRYIERLNMFIRMKKI
jgi:hypothetical protein